MKKIIVPVDFSQYSEYALETAAILAKKYGAEIVVLHMLEIAESIISSTGSLNYEEVLFFSKKAKNKFNQFLDKSYLEGIKVTDMIQYHKVFSEVNDVALNHDVDLIVMGSHGASGAKEFFLGSNTEKVIRHAEVPVLVVKEKMIHFEFKNVLLALDFKESNKSGYLKAMKFFKNINVDVTLIYINTPYEHFMSSDKIEESVHTFMKKIDKKHTNYKDIIYWNDYSVEKGILSYAQKINSRLIVIPTHGRKGLSHFFEGSIGEDIANHAKIPVLTFKI